LIFKEFHQTQELKEKCDSTLKVLDLDVLSTETALRIKNAIRMAKLLNVTQVDILHALTIENSISDLRCPFDLLTCVTNDLSFKC
jgi:hypothetical protein